MISFTLEQWYGWIHAFLWPFFRLTALAMTAPLLSDSSTPNRIKLGLSAFIAIVIAPTLPPLPDVPVASWPGLWISAQQILIGIGMGLTMRIVFAAVQTAGEFIGLQMGLSFASFFDPATGANTAVLSRIMNVVAMLLFLTLNGHLLMIGGLVYTFDILPIGTPALQADGWGVLLEFSTQVMVSGMLLALPLIIVLLSINLALGILNRTAQQLSVFVVGFPISLMVGLILLSIVLPQISPFMERLFQEGYETMGRLAWALRG